MTTPAVAEALPAASNPVNLLQPLAAENSRDGGAGERTAGNPSFPRPEEAFDLFETTLDEIVGRTRNAILADKAAPAHVLRHNLADLAAIQAQCRAIGEAEIESAYAVPQVDGGDGAPAREVGSAKQGSKKCSRGKKAETADVESQSAACEQGLGVRRQLRKSQRSTARS